MTENEAQMQTGRSPSETALKLLMYCELSRSKAFTSAWIGVLANLKRPPVRMLAFWVAVAMRLIGLQPIDCKPNRLSAFDRAHFDRLFSRVGMLKRGSVDSARRAVGAPIPSKCLPVKRD